jgi:hypothetical protein
MLFTCNSPHVFVVQSPLDKASLLKARVVKVGQPEFADLDGKYPAGCKNPLVKSALPKTKYARAHTRATPGHGHRGYCKAWHRAIAKHWRCRRDQAAVLSQYQIGSRPQRQHLLLSPLRTTA